MGVLGALDTCGCQLLCPCASPSCWHLYHELCVPHPTTSKFSPCPCCPAADEEQPSPAGGGRVVLESVSPLPGLLGPLVDYGEDDEDGDTLPLRGGCLLSWVCTCV